MSISMCSDTDNVIISYFNEPKILTATSGIESSLKTMVSLAQVNKKLYHMCREKIEKLKEINGFINKYHACNEKYEDCIKDDEWNRRYPSPWLNRAGNPQLLDALFTGCDLPFARNQSSFHEYNDQVEQDIIKMIQLMPQSIHCNIGELRCRSRVTPLLVACLNTNIPIKIIDLLLKNGANPQGTLMFNGTQEISIDIDLRNELSNTRYEEIQALFKKYTDLKKI